MSFLGPLFIAMVCGFCFFCALFALAACFRSGQISREERDETNIGAPEGALIPFHHTRLDDKGLKLSVQAHHNPSRGGNA